MIDRAPHTDRPAKPDPRNRILSRDEDAALINACEADHVRLFVILALSTAVGRGAILELTWDRVYFDHNQVALATGEGGRRKGRATVPMTATLRAALSSPYAIRTCNHVIEYGSEPVRSIKTGFNAARRRANLTDVTFHDLRHTCAVRMAEVGSTMARIAQVLGHSDSRLTERVYARSAPDHLVDDVAHLDLARSIEPGA